MNAEHITLPLGIWLCKAGTEQHKPCFSLTGQDRPAQALFFTKCHPNKHGWAIRNYSSPSQAQGQFRMLKAAKRTVTGDLTEEAQALEEKSFERRVSVSARAAGELRAEISQPSERRAVQPLSAQTNSSLRLSHSIKACHVFSNSLQAFCHSLRLPHAQWLLLKCI